MKYSVSISKQPPHRSGGWRVSCFGLPTDDWNALGRRVAESFHRTEAAARRRASELARAWNAEILA